MRMIDADALAEAMGVKRLMIQSWKADSAWGVPIVDAEPVVRCKDCRHFVISEGVCALLSNNYEPPVYCGDEDFCSWGRRKERKGGDK